MANLVHIFLHHLSPSKGVFISNAIGSRTFETFCRENVRCLHHSVFMNVVRMTPIYLAMEQEWCYIKPLLAFQNGHIPPNENIWTESRFLLCVDDGHKSAVKYAQRRWFSLSLATKLTTPLDGNYTLITNAHRQNVTEMNIHWTEDRSVPWYLVGILQSFAMLGSPHHPTP